MSAALEGLETPRLILDLDRLERNARDMRTRCAELGVKLRPQLKTAKSVEVAEIAKPGDRTCVTVSTLKEAEHFANHGFDDILYAATITPNKFERAARIRRDTNARVVLTVDSIAMAEALSAFCASAGISFDVVIEIDCGEHRGGITPTDADIGRIAAILEAGPLTRCAGVMTHAGHSYTTDDRAQLADIAETERAAAVTAAGAVRAAGCKADIVSVGSTPTALFARHLDGVTDVRCGIYMFWDLAQASRGICALDRIALSVLSTVIGHNRQSGALILDAGALALSKDIGANTFLPDAGYGYVCDPATLQRFGGLAISAVHQEHATVPLDNPAWFERLPIGALVSILPNHACLTAAAYPGYWVVSNGAIVATWPRVNGWD